MRLTEREQFVVLTNNETSDISGDVIVVLEGDGGFRIKTAAELFHAGRARHILFSGGAVNHGYGSYPFEHLLPEFRRCGVPIEEIINENKSQNTKEQAVNVIEICLQRGWNSILLVASHYHQYRAFLTFLKVLELRGIDRQFLIFNAPCNLPWFSITPWGIRFELLNQEFERIDTYVAKGDVANYLAGIKYLEWRMKL